MPTDSLERARATLAGAARVTALTGSGISAESGVPTFRGAGGLWRTHRAEDLATPEAFTRDPRMVWEWYAWRQEVVALAEPNAGHAALAALERRLEPGAFTLVTQNVDGLHQRAGNTEPLELHGTLWRVRCTECGEERALIEPVTESLPPRCALCDGIERPGVVWFGEELPEEVFEMAVEACRRSDVVVVVGTSGVVYPAAALVEIARAAGATVIDVNPEARGPDSERRIALAGPAGTILPALVR